MFKAALRVARRIIAQPSQVTPVSIVDGRIIVSEPSDPAQTLPDEIEEIDLTLHSTPATASAHPDQILLKDGRIILRSNIIRRDEQYGGWWHSVAGLTFFTPRDEVLAIQHGERIIPMGDAPTEAEIEADLDELASYNEPEPAEYHLTPDDTPLEVIVEQCAMPSARPEQPESVAPANVAPPLPEPQPDATPEPTPRRTLTPDEIELFHATAKRLCAERDRDGVWMGLLLHGVSVSVINTLTLIGKAHVEETNGKRHKIPAWLHNALNLIEATEWRRSRNVIHKELKKYEITPSLLTTAAVPTGQRA